MPQVIHHTTCDLRRRQPLIAIGNQLQTDKQARAADIANAAMPIGERPQSGRQVLAYLERIFLQAFVFALLAAVYIDSSLHPHH